MSQIWTYTKTLQEATAHENILNFWPALETTHTPGIEAEVTQGKQTQNGESFPQCHKVTRSPDNRGLVRCPPSLFSLMFLFLDASWSLCSYLLNMKIIKLLENPCNICLNVLNKKFCIEKTLKFNPRTNFASSRTRQPNSRESAFRHLWMTL